MDKDEALAIAFANLKGPRDKDYMATAEALAFLRSLPEYSSNAAVGRAVLVSGEIVREFIALNRLPPEIKDMFRKRLLRLEHGRRLIQLSAHAPEKVSEVAHVLTELNALESRSLVLYILSHPKSTVKEAIQRVREAVTVVEDEYHVVAILDSDEFQDVSRRARRARKPISEFVSSIIREWLVLERG